MKNRIDLKSERVGEIHITKENCSLTIIKYVNCDNITIQFSNGWVIEGVTYSNIKNGSIKNLYHTSVHKIGYFGVGSHTSIINGKRTKEYLYWKRMLQRCYSEDYLEKQPTYKDVTVCEEWHNFQNFAKWYDKNFNTKIMQDWHLDKDILFKGNKTYSPETCCFVPREINSLFIKRQNKRGIYPIGVSNKGEKFAVNFLSKGSRYKGTFNTSEEAFQAYKIGKETYIKEVADKWKDQITEQTYQALINYKVEITD